MVLIRQAVTGQFFSSQIDIFQQVQHSKTFATNQKDQRGQNCVNSFNGIGCSDNSSHFYTGIEFGWQKIQPANCF